MLGYVPVYQGTNTGVKVAIEGDRVNKDQPTLWAMLHTDQGEHGVLDWGKKATSLADTPLIYQDQPGDRGIQHDGAVNDYGFLPAMRPHKRIRVFAIKDATNGFVSQAPAYHAAGSSRRPEP